MVSETPIHLKAMALCTPLDIPAAAPVKPKLLFIQGHYDETLPRFLLTHKNEHVATLAHFFDVVVISEDFDLGRLCDLHEPDLILLESGVPNPACRRPKVSNLTSHAAIPRLGLLHSDAFCSGRTGFLSDMDHWGIENYVCISVAAPSYNQALEGALFVWPNAIDPSVFRDYGQAKSIPVLFAGNQNPLYPWRRRVLRALSPLYESKSLVHPGYASGRAAQYVHGEDYARLLNSSWFVPTCGTVAKEVVRKHFEVPASRACLITERSHALVHAGFVDMQNCVFADESDAAGKIDWLLANIDRLKTVIDNGHRLVHERHTMHHRTQVHDWYILNRRRLPGQSIVQPSPFAGLELSDAHAHFSWPKEDNRDQISLLAKGDAALTSGDFSTAQKHYRHCASFVWYMPEPRLKMALCKLCSGDAHGAKSLLTALLQFELLSYDAADPDPVELSLFLLSMLCLGKTSEAVKYAEDFPWMSHPELDRTRRLILSLRPSDTVTPSHSSRASIRRRSLHRLPWATDQEWKQNVSTILKACRREDLLAELGALDLQPGLIGVVEQPFTAPTPQPSSHSAVRMKLRRAQALHNFVQSIQAHARTLANRLEEAASSYFLPYAVSSVKHEPFFAQLRAVVSDAKTKTVLALDTRRRSYALASIDAGSRESFTDHAICRSSLQVERALNNNSASESMVTVDVSYIYTHELGTRELTTLPWLHILESKFIFVEGVTNNGGRDVARRIEAVGRYSRSPLVAKLSPDTVMYSRCSVGRGA